MQDIKAFADIMDKLYDYSTSPSGCRTSNFKKLLPDITKALDLSKNKDWYKFCVGIDNRNNIQKYFDLSAKDLLRGDGNLLLDLFKPEEINLKIIDMAMHSKIPISVSRLKSNKVITDNLTNKYIANQIKTTDVYTGVRNQKSDEIISDMRLLSLWKNTAKSKYKKELTFKKAFNVYTLSEQLRFLRPDKWCVRYRANLTTIHKILTGLDLGDPFNKIVVQLIEYIKEFRLTSLGISPWEVKPGLRFIRDEPNDDLFKAYVRLQGKHLPSTEPGKLTDTEYLFQITALISDYYAAKYTEPMKGKN